MNPHPPLLPAKTRLLAPQAPCCTERHQHPGDYIAFKEIQIKGLLWSIEQCHMTLRQPYCCPQTINCHVRVPNQSCGRLTLFLTLPINFQLISLHYQKPKILLSASSPSKIHTTSSLKKECQVATFKRDFCELATISPDPKKTHL